MRSFSTSLGLTNSTSVKSRARRVVLAAWFAVIACMLPNVAKAQTTEGTSSRTAKDDALRTIPWTKLNQPTQEKLSAVTGSPSIYRRLPMKVIDCEPEMFMFLVRYPEVVVNIWEIMGVSNVNIRRTGDYTFAAADAGATTCNVELIYGSPNMHILYADAVYEGGLLTGKVRGKCVLMLTSDYHQQDGRTMVTSRMDMFVKIENLGADLIARTLSPMIGKSADFNFTETADFISRVSVASQTDHVGVTQLAGRLENCAPAVQTKFAEITVAMHDRYQKSMADSRQAYPQPQPQPTTTSQMQPAPSVSQQPYAHPYPYQVNGQGGGYRQ